MAFSKTATDYANRPVPSTAEWQQLWKAWDVITKSMIPRDELLDKPIKLRNNLIFYLGHIPTFAGRKYSHRAKKVDLITLDIHMTKATLGKPTEPAYYVSIFERGIDPGMF